MNIQFKIIALSLLSSFLFPLPSMARSVIKDINRTGTIRVGIRQDAAPFGYLNPETNEWQGYCFDIVNSLKLSLEEKLEKPLQLELVKSTLNNRYEIVPQGIVHLECGPNTIRDDLESVTFSTPFFITGSHFLIRSDNSDRFSLGHPIDGAEIGALMGTITEDLLPDKYPQAEITYLEGENARSKGVEAVANGSLDGFFSDGILLIGEVVRQNLASGNFSLMPERPITCDAYGMILPAGDPQWQDTVNSFIEGDSARQVWGGWFEVLFPYVLLNLEYCEGKIPSINLR